MSDITEAYDYSVAQKAEGSWVWKRIGLITVYVLLPVIALILIMGPLKGLVYMGAFIVLADAVLVFFTWRFVNIEYMYSVKSGTVTFSVIQNAFNHRIPKKKLEFALKDCTLIAPKNEEYTAKYNAYAPVSVYNALSSVKASDAYFALFEDSDGKHCAFLFEATGDMLKRCKFYNKENTVIAQVRF